MDHVDRSCILYCRYLCSKTVGCGICQWICRILEIVLYDLGKDNKKWCVYGDVLLYAWDANLENPSNKNSIHLHNLSFYTLCCGSVLSVRMEKTVATCCVGACSWVSYYATFAYWIFGKMVPIYEHVTVSVPLYFCQSVWMFSNISSLFPRRNT